MEEETPKYLLTREQIEKRLADSFSPEQTDSLVYVIDNIREIELHRAAETSELKQGLTALTKEIRNLSERVTFLSDAQIETDHSVKALTHTQQRTDEQLAELIQAQLRTGEQLAELTQAQQRTDERLVESIERTDQRFAELREAQQRTDERLTESIERLEKSDERLANSIGRLEISMNSGFAELREAIKETNRQVGSLANTFGFSLEEYTGALLPPYLARYFDIIDLELGRRYFNLPEGLTEVDLFGEGTRNGRPVTVLAEARTSLGGGEARRLAEKLAAVADTIEGDVERILVAMNVHPTAETAATETGVHIIPYTRINRDRG